MILYQTLLNDVNHLSITAVGKAFGVLNDSEKRKRYDVYGSEAERAPSSGRRSYHSHNGHHYEFDGKQTAYSCSRMKYFSHAVRDTMIINLLMVAKADRLYYLKE